MTGEFGVGAPWPPGYGAAVRCLTTITTQALAMQPEADAAIRACGITGTVSSEVAVRLGEMLRAYSKLYYEAEAEAETARTTPGTRPGAELDGVRRDLRELLSYHLHMLRDAGDLVFSGRDVPRNERFRLELAEGLGSRGEDLVRLREQLIWDRCD